MRFKFAILEREKYCHQPPLFGQILGL